MDNALPEIISDEYLKHCQSLRKGLLLLQSNEFKTFALLRKETMDNLLIERHCHVVIIEEEEEDSDWYTAPVDSESVISIQRLGVDVKSKAAAIQRAQKTDVDILYFGDVANAEEAQLVFEACESGMLVVAEYLLSHGCLNIMRHLIEHGGDGRGEIVRMQIHDYLSALVSVGRAVCIKDEDHRILSDVFIQNKAMQNLIKDNMLHGIQMWMETSVNKGMRSIDFALKELWQSEKISRDELDAHVLNINYVLA